MYFFLSYKCFSYFLTLSQSLENNALIMVCLGHTIEHVWVFYLSTCKAGKLTMIVSPTRFFELPHQKTYKTPKIIRCSIQLPHLHTLHASSTCLMSNLKTPFSIAELDLDYRSTVDLQLELAPLCVTASQIVYSIPILSYNSSNFNSPND